MSSDITKADLRKRSKETLVDQVYTLLGEVDRLRQSVRSEKRIRSDMENALTLTARRELQGAYEHLDDLLKQLYRIHFLADPVTSATIGGSRGTRQSYISTDGISTSEGRGTKTDRDRMKMVDKWLGQLARRIELEHRPRGAPTEIHMAGGPQCWHRDCGARGLKQSWDQAECRSCGRRFGTWTPYFVRPAEESA